MTMLNLAEAALAAQAELHAAITDSDLLQITLGDPVRAFDETPENPVYPYLTYGDMRSTDTSADDAPESMHQITLHVWSQYEGRAEVLALIRTVADALDAALPHRVLPLYVDAIRARDGITFHGLLRLSITRLAPNISQ